MIIRYFSKYIVASILIWCGASFALTPVSNDVNFFSTSYQSQQESSQKYYQDAIIDFTKKLNIAIKNHTDLKVLSQSCWGCDVIMWDFDTYLKDHLPQKDYGVVITQFFSPNISRNISSYHQKSLNDLIAGMLTAIIEDTNYLIQTQQDLDAMGRYSDGDIENAPYDLIDDMKKVLWLLFQDAPEYEGYTNTMQNDASGLITGRFEVGQWAQGERYEIDLASDVAKAFWQDGENGGSSDDNGEDCHDGFCITLDMISNDQYSAGSRWTGFINTSFEEIVGSALDWLVQKGDKRNLACKAPPPVNHFQSNNDQNLSFANIFRGLGIFVFQKTPRYAQTDSDVEKEKSVEQKEKDMDGVIAASFKRYNIDPDNLMLFTEQQMIEQATPIAGKAGDTANNQTRTSVMLQQRQEIQRSGLISAKRNELGNPDEGTKNMFRSFHSWMQWFNTMISDTFDITKTWKEKPDCKN